MELQIEKQSRGVRIIAGQEAKERRNLLNGLIQIAESCGFEEIILPVIEPASVYTDKAGQEISGQMFSFYAEQYYNRFVNDGKLDLNVLEFGKKFCLRPEGTATIQLLADKYWKTQKDVKLWYFTRCYRYERPQSGRYREFFQFGIEVINPSNPDIKKELVSMAENMVKLKTDAYSVAETVKRGLAYYVEDGFEISVESLGAQKQVCGGGAYKQGIGFAIGFDRLMICSNKQIS